MLQRSLEMQRAIHGESHGNVAIALQDLGESLPPQEGVELVRQSLEMRRRLGLAPQSLAAGLNALGITYSNVGDVEAARESFEQALTILIAAHGEGHPIALTLLGNLASTTRDPRERESTARRLLELHLERFGRESEAVAGSWNQIGVALIEQGRLEEALEALGQSLEIWGRLVGEDHWRHANTTRNYGRVLQLQRRYSEALQYLERAHRVTIAERGADSPTAMYIRGQVAMVRLYLGSREATLGELVEVVSALRRSPNARYLTDSLVWQGLAHLELGQAPAAETSFQEALAIRETLFQEGVPQLAEARVAIGLAVSRQPDRGEGISMIEASLAALESWGLADPELVKKAREVLAED